MSSPKHTVYAAASPDSFRKMANRYGWSLRRIKPNGDKILLVGCEIEGMLNSLTTWRSEQVAERWAILEANSSDAPGWEKRILLSEASFTTVLADRQIDICESRYEPITPEWEKLERDTPVNKLMGDKA